MGVGDHLDCMLERKMVHRGNEGLLRYLFERRLGLGSRRDLGLEPFLLSED
jgi:hypothetical protein